MNFIKSLLERSAGTGTSATAANSHLLKDVPFASTDDADVFARYENETNTENASKLYQLVLERDTLPSCVLHALASQLLQTAQHIPVLLAKSDLSSTALEMDGGVSLLHAITHSLSSSASNRARSCNSRELARALVAFAKSCEMSLRRSSDDTQAKSANVQESLYLLASVLGAIGMWLDGEQGVSDGSNESTIMVLAVECNGLVVLSRLIGTLHALRGSLSAKDGTRAAATAVELSTLRCVESALNDPDTHRSSIYRDALRAAQVSQRLIDAIGYPPCNSLLECLLDGSEPPEEQVAAAASDVDVQASALRCVSVWFARHEAAVGSLVGVDDGGDPLPRGIGEALRWRCAIGITAARSPSGASLTAALAASPLTAWLSSFASTVARTNQHRDALLLRRRIISQALANAISVTHTGKAKDQASPIAIAASALSPWHALQVQEALQGSFSHASPPPVGHPMNVAETLVQNWLNEVQDDDANPAGRLDALRPPTEVSLWSKLRDVSLLVRALQTALKCASASSELEHDVTLQLQVSSRSAFASLLECIDSSTDCSHAAAATCAAKSLLVDVPDVRWTREAIQQACLDANIAALVDRRVRAASEEDPNASALSDRACELISASRKVGVLSFGSDAEESRLIESLAKTCMTRPASEIEPARTAIMALASSSSAGGALVASSAYLELIPRSLSGASLEAIEKAVTLLSSIETSCSHSGGKGLLTMSLCKAGAFTHLASLIGDPSQNADVRQHALAALTALLESSEQRRDCAGTESPISHEVAACALEHFEEQVGWATLAEAIYRGFSDTCDDFTASSCVDAAIQSLLRLCRGDLNNLSGVTNVQMRLVHPGALRSILALSRARAGNEDESSSISALRELALLVLSSRKNASLAFDAGIANDALRWVEESPSMASMHVTPADRAADVAISPTDIGAQLFAILAIVMNVACDTTCLQRALRLILIKKETSVTSGLPAYTSALSFTLSEAADESLFDVGNVAKRHMPGEASDAQRCKWRESPWRFISFQGKPHGGLRAASENLASLEGAAVSNSDALRLSRNGYTIWLCVRMAASEVSGQSESRASLAHLITREGSGVEVAVSLATKRICVRSLYSSGTAGLQAEAWVEVPSAYVPTEEWVHIFVAHRPGTALSAARVHVTIDRSQSGEVRLRYPRLADPSIIAAGFCAAAPINGNSSNRAGGVTSRSTVASKVSSVLRTAENDSSNISRKPRAESKDGSESFHGDFLMAFLFDAFMESSRCAALMELGLHYQGALHGAETFESPINHKALAALRGYVMRPHGTHSLAWDTAQCGTPCRPLLGFHAAAVGFSGRCCNIAEGDSGESSFHGMVRGAHWVYVRPLSRALRSLGGAAALLPLLDNVLCEMQSCGEDCTIKCEAENAIVRLLRAMARLTRDPDGRLAWRAASGSHALSLAFTIGKLQSDSTSASNPLPCLSADVYDSIADFCDAAQPPANFVASTDQGALFHAAEADRLLLFNIDIWRYAQRDGHGARMGRRALAAGGQRARSSVGASRLVDCARELIPDHPDLAHYALAIGADALSDGSCNEYDLASLIAISLTSFAADNHSLASHAMAIMAAAMKGSSPSSIYWQHALSVDSQRSSAEMVLDSRFCAATRSAFLRSASRLGDPSFASVSNDANVRNKSDEGDEDAEFVRIPGPEAVSASMAIGDGAVIWFSSIVESSAPPAAASLSVVVNMLVSPQGNVPQQSRDAARALADCVYFRLYRSIDTNDLSSLCMMQSIGRCETQMLFDVANLFMPISSNMEISVASQNLRIHSPALLPSLAFVILAALRTGAESADAAAYVLRAVALSLERSDRDAHACVLSSVEGEGISRVQDAVFPWIRPLILIWWNSLGLLPSGDFSSGHLGAAMASRRCICALLSCALKRLPQSNGARCLDHAVITAWTLAGNGGDAATIASAALACTITADAFCRSCVPLATMGDGIRAGASENEKELSTTHTHPRAPSWISLLGLIEDHLAEESRARLLAFATSSGQAALEVAAYAEPADDGQDMSMLQTSASLFPSHNDNPHLFDNLSASLATVDELLGLSVLVDVGADARTKFADLAGWAIDATPEGLGDAQNFENHMRTLRTWLFGRVHDDTGALATSGNTFPTPLRRRFHRSHPYWILQGMAWRALHCVHRLPRQAPQYHAAIRQRLSHFGDNPASPCHVPGALALAYPFSGAGNNAHEDNGHAGDASLRLAIRLCLNAIYHADARRAAARAAVLLPLLPQLLAADLESGASTTAAELAEQRRMTPGASLALLLNPSRAGAAAADYDAAAAAADDQKNHFARCRAHWLLSLVETSQSREGDKNYAPSFVNDQIRQQLLLHAGPNFFAGDTSRDESSPLVVDRECAALGAALVARHILHVLPVVRMHDTSCDINKHGGNHSSRVDRARSLVRASAVAIDRVRAVDADRRRRESIGIEEAVTTRESCWRSVWGSLRAIAGYGAGEDEDSAVRWKVDPFEDPLRRRFRLKRKQGKSRLRAGLRMNEVRGPHANNASLDSDADGHEALQAALRVAAKARMVEADDEEDAGVEEDEMDEHDRTEEAVIPEHVEDDEQDETDGLPLAATVADPASNEEILTLQAQVKEHVTPSHAEVTPSGRLHSRTESVQSDGGADAEIAYAAAKAEGLAQARARTHSTLSAFVRTTRPSTPRADARYGVATEDVDCMMVTYKRVITGTLSIWANGCAFRGEFDKNGKKCVVRRLFDLRALSEVHLTRHLLDASAIELFFDRGGIASGQRLQPGSPTGGTFTSGSANVSSRTEGSAMLHFQVGGASEARRVATLLISQQRETLPGRKPAVLFDRRQRLRTAHSLCERWRRGELSTFAYLSKLNTLAGRSYNDWTQYPIYPWVLSDYVSESIDPRDHRVHRDLSLPMGIVSGVSESADARRRVAEERYHSMQELADPNMPPFHYGTHYSTNAGVLYYLLRLEPYRSAHIELQSGRIDHADRLFHSVAEAYASATSSAADVKELVPEFYYNPEMFHNGNEETDLGVREKDGAAINDVVLPPWCGGCSATFVGIMREALESEACAHKLPQWIDLIFGYRQRGAAAVEACNVFHYLSYERAIDIDQIEDDHELRVLQDTIRHFGQTPMQLFRKRHPLRYAKLGLEVAPWPGVSLWGGVTSTNAVSSAPALTLPAFEPWWQAASPTANVIKLQCAISWISGGIFTSSGGRKGVIAAAFCENSARVCCVSESGQVAYTKFSGKSLHDTLHKAKARALAGALSTTPRVAHAASLVGASSSDVATSSEELLAAMLTRGHSTLSSLKSPVASCKLPPLQLFLGSPVTWSPGAVPPSPLAPGAAAIASPKVIATTTAVPAPLVFIGGFWDGCARVYRLGGSATVAAATASTVGVADDVDAAAASMGHRDSGASLESLSLRCVQRLPWHTNAPSHLATSRDGAIAATGAEDTSVVLWAQATDKDSITSPDGAAAEVVAYALACLTPQFQQHQSDIITRPVLSPEDSNHEVGALRNTHSAAAAAAARANAEAGICRVIPLLAEAQPPPFSPKPRAVLLGHTGAIRSLYVADALGLVASSSDAADTETAVVMLHDVSGVLVRRMFLPRSSPKGGCAMPLHVVTETAMLVFQHSADLSLHAMSINGRHVAQVQSIGEVVHAIAAHPGGHLMAIVGERGVVSLRTLPSLALVTVLVRPDDPLWLSVRQSDEDEAAKGSPTSSLVSSISLQLLPRLLSTTRGAARAAIRADNACQAFAGSAMSVAFSDDGQFVIAGFADGGVFAWAMEA